MNYEKVIVELLSRIQELEEKVDFLMGVRESGAALKPREEPVRDVVKVKTSDIRDYINGRKEAARSRGADSLILRASEVHRVNRLRNAMPMVCNAMRQCMEDKDVVLHETPSGYSSSLEIKYML